MGLLSAVGVAIYSISPVDLLYKYGTLPIVGLGCLLVVLLRLYYSINRIHMQCGMHGLLLVVSMSYSSGR